MRDTCKKLNKQSNDWEMILNAATSNPSTELNNDCKEQGLVSYER